jgi:hypothetical protein
MRTRTFIGRSLRLALLFVLGLAGSFASCAGACPGAGADADGP